MLGEALKKAQRSAQEPPIASQVTQCEKFTAMEKRLAQHDQQRVKLASELEDGRSRLSQLRAAAEAALENPGPA